MFYYIAKAASDAAGSGSGEESQWVTCSGLDCTACGLIQMVVNIFYYLTWYIAFPLAVLFLVIGGFIYIGSRGNERWMSFAKRGIMYTIGGFIVSILAFMAINTLVQVLGGSDNGIWSKFECGSESSASLKKLPESNIASLTESAKSGGQLSGKLAKNTSANDIIQLMNKLDPSDMLVFESELQGTRKVLMTVGKNNGQMQLLHIDRSTINQILSDRQTSSIINAAQANNLDAALQELVNEISQVTAKIIASNHDLFVIITGKPDSASVSSILSAISKADQCVNSGGAWYRFSDICTAQKEKCDATKCTPSGNNLVADCKCPSDQCLRGGQCVKRTE